MQSVNEAQLLSITFLLVLLTVVPSVFRTFILPLTSMHESL